MAFWANIKWMRLRKIIELFLLLFHMNVMRKQVFEEANGGCQVFGLKNEVAIL